MDDEIVYNNKNNNDESTPLTGQAYMDFIEMYRWHKEHGEVEWKTPSHRASTGRPIDD